MSSSLPTFIDGYDVALPSIERELTTFWKNIAGSQQNVAVLRATTLNLIIIVRGREGYEQARELVPKITAHHPGRIILVYMDPQRETQDISARIAIYCQPPHNGGRQICCEYINLVTNDNDVQQIHGAVLPLLLPDLPVFLYAPDEHLLREGTLEDFTKMSTRMVVNLPTELTRPSLLDLSERILNLQGTNVSDLAWSALTTWREALAQFFDTKKSLDQLNQLSSLSITTSGSPNSTPAMLLISWLGARLDWQFDSRSSGRQFAVRFNDHIVDIHFFSAGSEIESGGLLRVELTATGNGAQISFTCQRTPDNCLRLQKTENGVLTLDNTMSLTAAKNECLLCGELDFIDVDKVYNQTLEKLQQLLKD